MNVVLLGTQNIDDECGAVLFGLYMNKGAVFCTDPNKYIKDVGIHWSQ